MSDQSLFPLRDPNKKLAGLLVPVSALRHKNDFGIGDTQAVLGAIRFCAANAIAVLQILPIHECVGDYSPYNGISSQALSPSLLTLTEEKVPGLLKKDIEEAAPEAWLGQLRKGNVKYNSVQSLKQQLLLEAHRDFRNSENALKGEFATFQQERESWLPAYTLFRLLIREYEGNTNWTEWRPEHQSLDQAEGWLARHEDVEELKELREGYAFIQWVAWRQWREVRQVAEEHKVFLMGEMSYGVSRCSVDVWHHPELFDLEWYVGSQPTRYFDTNKDSERWGQNWGLPAYRWENHRSNNFAWLRERLQGERQFFHLCRLDHLRGYFRAYMFPWAGGPTHGEFGQLTEEEARQRTGGKLPRFVPGPDTDEMGVKMNDLQGRDIIRVMQEAAQEMYLVAEIMGVVPDYMKKALDDLKMPNLTFPQLERNEDRSIHPLESFRRLSLITYANHDHAPLAAYYLHLREKARANPDGEAAKDLHYLLQYVDWKGQEPDTMTDELWTVLIQKLFQAPCQLAVLMSSDLLGIPQRFNLPGSYGVTTWSERLEFDLEEYSRHAVFANRIATAKRLIIENHRQFNEETPSTNGHA